MMKKQYKPSIKLSHQKLMSTKTHRRLSSCTSRRKLSTRTSCSIFYFVLRFFFYFTSIDAISDKVNRLLLNHNMVAREQNNMYIVHSVYCTLYMLVVTFVWRYWTQSTHLPPQTNRHIEIVFQFVLREVENICVPIYHVWSLWM